MSVDPHSAGFVHPTRRWPRRWPGRVLVTGGAGFIGTNAIRHLVHDGVAVTAFDSFRRPGSERNLDLLQRELDSQVRVVVGDVRDADAVDRAVADVDAVLHLAGQTAVTTSLDDPRGDMFDNAVGTFNVVDAARRSPKQPIVVYASTNKVYGSLDDLAVAEEADHYRLVDLPHGIPESRPLDFASPYACSKGAGELYVRDFARTYGVPTVVIRQSCIYGERQLGVEDQGWLAWFVRSGLSGQPLTIFGDGKQVRDLLHVDDLIDVYHRAMDRIDDVSGDVFNVGGGADRSMSIWWQLRPTLEAALGTAMPEPTFGPWRTGDQKIFIADIAKAREKLGWTPAISTTDGLNRLVDWFRTSDR